MRSLAGEIKASWAERQKNVARRKDALTGVNEFPNILEEPVVFLSVDTPRRRPTDIIFVNPEDGTPESFIKGA